MRLLCFLWLAPLLGTCACTFDLTPTESGPSPGGTAKPGGSEKGRMVGMLAAHNAVRADVSANPPLPDLAWSADLAQVAQAYADRLSGSCDLVHSKGQYGENLASFGGQQATPEQVVDLWAEEGTCWTFGAFMRSDACNESGPCRGGCGHYTQLVWRNTELVGCGVASCGGNSEVWVCNYDPPGNFVGDEPY